MEVKHKHKEGLMVALENNELKIKSTELVEVINEFRKLESETANSKYVELRHNDFMTKIKKELEVLKVLNLGGERNFSQSTYISSQNKVQPCFELNRDGMLQMLNSESTLVRYKTIEYINTMENKIKGQATPQLKPLTTEEMLELQFKYAKEVKEKVDNVDNRVTTLEERMTIETGAQKVLCDLVNKKVITVLGGKDSPAYAELGKKAFRQCWKNFKDILQVASYKDTPVKDFDLAKKVIIDWQPNRELELMIRGCNAQMRM